MIVNTVRAIRNRIYQQIEANKFDKGYIKVTYKPKVYNDAEFTNKTDGKWFLKEFTSRSLLDYMEKNEFRT